MTTFRYQNTQGESSAIVEERQRPGEKPEVTVSVKNIQNDGPAYQVGSIDDAKTIIQALAKVVDKYEKYRQVVSDDYRSLIGRGGV